MAKPLSPFAQYTMEILEDAGEVRIKAMFGGYGIYLDETMSAIIVKDTLFFKVTGLNQADYEAAGTGPFLFVPKSGKPSKMSYWEVPAEVLENKELLVDWFRTAHRAAMEAKK